MARSGLTLMELVIVLVILVIIAAIAVPLVGNALTDAKPTTTRATMTALRDAILRYHQDMKGIALPRTPPGTSLTIDASGVPQTLKDLQMQPVGAPKYDPVTRRGWRGPYLLSNTGLMLPQASAPAAGFSLDSSFYPSGNLYGNVGDIAFIDGWGAPIVLQWPSVNTSGMSDANQDLSIRAQNVRLVSAGEPTTNASGHSASIIETSHDLIPLKASRGNDIVLFVFAQDPNP